MRRKAASMTRWLLTAALVAHTLGCTSVPSGPSLTDVRPEGFVEELGWGPGYEGVFVRPAPTPDAPRAVLCLLLDSRVADRIGEPNRTLRSFAETLPGAPGGAFDVRVPEELLEVRQLNRLDRAWPPIVVWLDPVRGRSRLVGLDEWRSLATPVTASRSQEFMPLGVPDGEELRSLWARAVDRSGRFRAELVADMTAAGAESLKPTLVGTNRWWLWLRVYDTRARRVVGVLGWVPKHNSVSGAVRHAVAWTHDSQHVIVLRTAESGPYGLLVAATGLPPPEEPWTPAGAWHHNRSVGSDCDDGWRTATQSRCCRWK